MSIDDDRSTRDLVIGLVKDVQHLREQLDKVLKLEDRMLACERQAQEATSHSARLVWLIGGVGIVLVMLAIAVVPKLIK